MLRATLGVALVEIFLWSCLAGLLGLGGGAFFCWKLIRRQDRLNLNSAQNRAAEILAQSAKEAENVRKEAELRAKDEFIQKREQFNREVEQSKGELREQERRLEKREDGLEQKHQVLLKKERLLQHNDKKLHERKDLLETKLKEVDELRELQTAKLHEISHLSRPDAEKVLLERLDRELAGEIANRIQKQEEMLRSSCEAKAREILATSIQRYAAEHTADNTVRTA